MIPEVDLIVLVQTISKDPQRKGRSEEVARNKGGCRYEATAETHCTALDERLDRFRKHSADGTTLGMAAKGARTRHRLTDNALVSRKLRVSLYIGPQEVSK